MKLFLQVLLIIVIISTISICTVKPDLHKNVVVYDSAYTLVPEEEVKTEKKEFPVAEVSSKPVEKFTVVDIKPVPVDTVSEPKTKNVQTNTTVKPKQTAAVEHKVTSVTPKVEQKTEVIPSPKPVVVRSEAEPAVTKVLTEQEETIAWNKWRSALTNKIMEDTKLPDIPNGTVFQFSFNVDKYGRITNLQTGANPSTYTPQAIQYIAPVIRSYQGRSILNFPEGTQRTTTQVTGKWRISNVQKYSTPQDYNDIEKVVR